MNAKDATKVSEKYSYVNLTNYDRHFCFILILYVDLEPYLKEAEQFNMNNLDEFCTDKYQNNIVYRFTCCLCLWI